MSLLGRVLRRLRRPRRHPRPAILMYHRVAVLANDPWQLAVSPEHFNEQMAWLARHRTPMLVQDMLTRLGQGTLPANAIAVTFDDGYRDNLVHASPSLTRHKVPATLFLATGFVGREEPYWWDELAAMILEAREPVTFLLPLDAETLTLTWNAMEPDDLAPTWRGWDEPRTARQHHFFAVWSRLRLLPEAERSRLMAHLREQLPTHTDRLSWPMGSEEVSALLAQGSFTLGAHTVSHPVLPHLASAARQAEIRESIAESSRHLGHPVTGFAYPFGDLDDRVRDDLAVSGLHWACTTHAGFLDEGSPPDPFRLPRIGVADSSLPGFIHLITR